MQTIEHALFPTLVLETFNEDHALLKKTFEKKILNHIGDDGFSNGETGHLTIHHDKSFRPIFELATKASQTYMQRLKVDPSIYDFNLVKVWMNMVRNQATPTHHHRDCHLSFVYYIHIPEGLEMPLTFQRDEYRHEPFAGCIKHGRPSEWDWLNSYTWSFPPREGVMFVFPANMLHGTPPRNGERDTGIFSIEDFRKHRVSIAGDFVLTYKERYDRSLGIPPVKNWRTF